MSQTKEGAIKAKATMLSKYGESYFREIGAKGGSVSNPKKGFGYDDRTVLERILRKRKLAVRAGAKGGSISKRTKHEVQN